MTHSEVVSFIWSVAASFGTRSSAASTRTSALPLTVLRRLDCVLAPTKKKVLGTNAKFRGKGIENVDPALRKASGFAFWNTSKYDFGSLLDDHAHLKQNLRNYIQHFSPNMRETLEKFDFDNTIANWTRRASCSRSSSASARSTCIRVACRIRSWGRSSKS